VKKKLPVLIALVIAITSFGIDPSHARRVRFSTPAAKAAPVAAAKAAPAAAVKRTPVAAPARKDDGVARAHFHVMPGVVIRPSNSAAATGAPMATSAPMAAAAPVAAIGTGAPAAEASAPAIDASKREETPARPAQRHFVDLNPDPPKLQREVGPSPPPPPKNVTLCFKTATGKCGSL
jgi:hypothetical protein